jgi:hypothetical protein
MFGQAIFNYTTNLEVWQRIAGFMGEDWGILRWVILSSD